MTERLLLADDPEHLLAVLGDLARTDAGNRQQLAFGPRSAFGDLGKDGVKDHKFYPETLTFETGKLYRLVIHNPSNSKHYFTSLGLSSRVFTRKVQIMDDIGVDRKQIAEVKGAIREIEVYPGGTTEWWFVPISTGTMTDLSCSIKEQDGETHAHKGMKGTIVIN